MRYCKNVRKSKFKKQNFIVKQLIDVNKKYIGGVEYGKKYRIIIKRI